MKSTIESVSRARDAASSKYSLLKSHTFGVETFNAMSNLPKTIRQAAIRDGDTMTNAPQWCEEIWKTMRKNDFATQGSLNLQIVENIFNIHHKKFEKLLNITTATELFEIMDADEDGSINEDEQILLFSIIKEKMLKIADDLCQIQEYVRYRDLMKAVRKLEQQIAKYQDILRNKIYKSELNLYEEIGESRFEDFYEYYEKEFKNLNTYSLEREAAMRAQHEDELNNLIEKLDSAAVAVKFKPKAQLREYQTQEKLVSVDERVEEALNFRKELKDLEVSEAHRINKMRDDNIKRQRNVLLTEQLKEMRHLQDKMNNEENKLIIRMKRDFDVLKKKTHLHENEIKKIQGLAAKYAMQKASHDGELQRMKAKSRKFNDILVTNQGASNGGLSPRSTSPTQRRNSQFLNTQAFNSTDGAGKAQVDYMKTMAKSSNIVKFHLKKSYGEELPQNVKPTNYAKEDKLSHKKVEIYLGKKIEKKDEIPNLTSLYDENLRPIRIAEEDKVEKMSVDEKKRIRQFINEKLNGDRKIVM